LAVSDEVSFGYRICALVRPSTAERCRRAAFLVRHRMSSPIVTAAVKHHFYRTSIKIALVVAAAYALWRWVDWARVGASLLTMSTWGVLLAFALASADRVLMGFKWRHLVRAGGGTMRLRDAVSIYYQTSFADHVLPNLVTSEALRVYLGRRRAVPAPLLLGSMAIERMLGAVAAVALAGVGLLVVAAQLEPQMRGAFLEIVIMASVIGALAIVAAWWTPLHRLAGRALRKWIPPRLFSLLEKLSRTLVAYRAQPAALILNLLMAVGENLLMILNFYVIGRALGVQLPAVPFFAVIAVTSLVRRVAMYIEGRGLGEGSAIVMFTFLGVQKDAAVALTFAHYAVWLAASLPGAYLLFRSGVSFRDVSRASALS
jgi:glycosyltransferase 2 family protein